MESLRTHIEEIQHLNAEEWELARSAFRQTQLKKGEMFSEAGQVAQQIALIASGTLRTFHKDESGVEVTTDLQQEGAYAVSFRSYLSQNPAFQSIQALEDCQLWVVHRLRFQELLNEHLVFNKLYIKIVEDYFIAYDDRGRNLQKLSAREKYLQLMQERPQIIQRVPLKYIASFLGIKLETLSRVRASL